MSADQNRLLQIEHVLRTVVAPAMNLDPEPIKVMEFENGIASVRLAGVCASCPASLPTIITEMENELRKLIPEVEAIEAVA